MNSKPWLNCNATNDIGNSVLIWTYSTADALDHSIAHNIETAKRILQNYGVVCYVSGMSQKYYRWTSYITDKLTTTAWDRQKAANQYNDNDVRQLDQPKMSASFTDH